MANEKDIEIGIKTTADTSGLDKTEAGIQRVRQRTEEDMRNVTDKVGIAQWGFYDLDAEISKTGNTIERVNAGPLTNLSKGAAQATDRTRNMGMLVNQAGYQITDFAVQVQGGTSAITAFSQQAPQLAGAFSQLGIVSAGLGTAISLGAAAAGIGFQLTSNAYKQMKADMTDAENAARRYVDQQEFMVQQQAKLANLTRQGFIADIYEKEAEELERQVRAMQRINELRAAVGGAEAARAAADLTIAQNSGGDTTQAQGAVLTVGVQNQLAALDGKLAEAVAKAEQAARNADGLTAQMNEIAREGDEFSDKYQNAAEAARTATAAAEEAQLDLENERAKYVAAKDAIIANADAGLSTLQTEAQAAVTAAAQQTQAALVAQAAEAGGNISSSAREAIAGLERILADGVVRPEEMTRLTEAMARIRASREGADAEILSGLTSLDSTTKAVLGVLPGIVSSIRALESQVETIQQRY